MARATIPVGSGIPMRLATHTWAWSLLRARLGGDTTPSVGAASSADTTVADGTVAAEAMVRIVTVVCGAEPAAFMQEVSMDLVDSMVAAVEDSTAAGTGKNKPVMHQMFG